jgi:hypothetical protein
MDKVVEILSTGYGDDVIRTESGKVFSGFLLRESFGKDVFSHPYKVLPLEVVR